MRNYLAACTHVYLVACRSMHAYLVGLEALDLISVRASLSTRTAFLDCVRTDTTMDPRCAWAANVLVRVPRLIWVVDVHITDLFVLLMHVFQIVLAISCLKKTPVLARYQSIFYTNYSEKIQKTQWFCYLRILHLLRISFYFSESQRVPGCNSMADLSLKIVFWTH